jgi:hypothetical protein
MHVHYPIATIINFCSNDYPFLRACIESVKPFSSQILIPVCDHFFDGVPEKRETLHKIYAEHPEVEFIEFPFDAQQSLYGLHSAFYWHNLARMIARFFLKEEIAYVLFLDCDEIVDSQKFMEWMRVFPYSEYAALKVSNYWYFRECHLQAKQWEETPLLAKKEALEGAILMNDRGERGDIYALIPGKKKKETTNLDGLPMIHHYSWVRTKEQLIRKVLSWSHREERDWTRLVEEEFSGPPRSVDFVHGYELTQVSPFCEIDLSKRPQESADSPFSHVRRLTHAEVVKIDVSLTFHIPCNL